MSKIAFDLDGVLVPDYHHIPSLTMQEFYEQTLYAKPLFSPVGAFDVVTARSAEYRDITEQWINQLAIRPQTLIMKTDANESAAEFKYRICIEQGYTLYIESDPEIVQQMRKLANYHGVDIGVVHFAGFIASSLKTDKL
jgi:FMN phosphatase YigB (HAD superfamily)